MVQEQSQGEREDFVAADTKTKKVRGTIVLGHLIRGINFTA